MKIKFGFLLIIILTLSLSSCTDVYKKKEAYCFSVLFDKNDDNYTLSVFCKSYLQSNTEDGKIEKISFDFTGKSPVEALSLSENHNYEIYYKSCVALFFSNSLSDDDINDIIIYLLNQTKYQSYVYIFNEKPEIDVLKKEAEKISESEEIDYYSKEKYLTLTEYIKENNI